MRWSLRRGNRDADGRASHDAPSAPPSVAPGQSGGAGEPDPGWRSVPPMAASWSSAAPLTTGPTGPAGPSDSSMLITAPPARRVAARPLAGADPLVPEPGQVTGLAQVRPLPPLRPTVPALPPTEYGDAGLPLRTAPLRHAPTRALSDHAPLTQATEAYVGEPLSPPPPTPPPAPAPLPPQTWVRPEPKVEAATEAGARFQEALANLHRSGLPRYESPTEGGGRPDARPAAAPPPAPTAATPAPGPAAAGEPPTLTHLRRNTLAQSRRLGLGAPLRRGEDAGDGGAADEAGDGDAEPAPAVPSPPPDFPAPTRAAQPYPDPSPAAAQSPTAAPPPPPEPPAPPATPTPEPSGAFREPIEPSVVPGRPIVDLDQRPALGAVPLVFRARALGPKLAAAAARSTERAVVTRPPAELAQALRASHGIDVGDVPVHRDRTATTEARERRARAFTRGGRVYLPEDAGSVTASQARGLLAHELVHAAQQRRLGTALPDEDSDLGRSLEAEARHAESMYSASVPETFAEPELVHAPPPVSAAWVHSAITQRAANDPAKDWFDPTVTTTLTGTQTQAFREAANAAVQRVIDDQRPTLQANAANPFSDLSAESQAERQFLEVINAELARRNEGPQSELTERDKEQVRRLFGGLAGGSTTTRVGMDQAFGNWQQQHLGSATAFGADIGGLAMLGGLFHRHHSGAQQGSGTGTGSGTTPGTGTGTGAGAGTATGRGTGTGTGTTTPQPGMGNVVGQWSSQHVGSASAFGADIGGLASFGQLFHRRHDQPGSQGHAGTPGTTPGQQAAATGAQPGGQAAQGQAGQPAPIDLDRVNLDDLAFRIYDRLRNRLRREFLIDRERAGLLTDFR